MDRNPEEWVRIYDGIGDLLFHLITDLSTAEKSVLDGSPRIEILLNFIHSTGITIRRLEVAYSVLQKCRIHEAVRRGEGPAEQLLGHDPAIVDWAVAQLVTRGILDPRAD